MKLHVPKGILLLISAAMIAQAADYNVGRYTGEGASKDAPLLPSQSGVYTYDASADLTLTDGDRVGIFNDSGKLITEFGSLSYDWNADPVTQSSTGVITQNLKVAGTLTIGGTAQVALGGQYKVLGSSWLAHDMMTVGNYDEYTGVMADTIVVNGDGSVTSLQASNATVNTLTVNSGVVNLHTDFANGNAALIQNAPQDSKQVQIKRALTVGEGGKVTIGKDDADHHTPNDEHSVVGFGELSIKTMEIQGYIIPTDYDIQSAKITQTGGELVVAGKSVSVGGLQIEQTGGKMSISEGSYHVSNDYADSRITQSGDDSELTVGKLIAYNTYYNQVVGVFEQLQTTMPDIQPSVDITQQGAGKIVMNGVDFTNQSDKTASTETSTITQSGAGSIELKGTYEGAEFALTQTGTGSITLAQGASMTANALTLNTDAALNVAGALTLSDNTGLNITVGNVGDTNGAIILQSGGILTAGGDAAITLSFADAVIDNMYKTATLDGKAYTYTLISGMEAAAATDLLGQLTLTLAETDLPENFKFQGFELVSEGGNINAKVTAVLPEPTTTSLYILALAGAFVRRRRK